VVVETTLGEPSLDESTFSQPRKESTLNCFLKENRGFLCKNGSRNFLAKLQRVNVYVRENKSRFKNIKWQPFWNDLLMGRGDKPTAACWK